MSLTKDSLSSQLESANRLQSNGLTIMQGFFEALTTDKQEVTVTITLDDGTTSDVTIPSNMHLNDQIERFKATIENITGLVSDSPNAIVSLDDNSSFREVLVQNYKRNFDLLKQTEIKVNGVNVSENALLHNLIAPATTVEIELPSRFITAKRVRATKINVSSDDLASFTAGESYASAIQKLVSIENTRLEMNIDVDNRRSRYFGNFSVITKETQENATVNLTFTSISYSDSDNVVENSRELAAGDRLVTSDGIARVLVNSVSTVSQNGLYTVNVSVEAGYGEISVGIDTLSFLSVDTDEKRTVQVPFKQDEKVLLFLSIVHPQTGVESAYSEVIIMDSDEFIVSEGVNNFTFNEYWTRSVVDIGQYFESIVRERGIPASFGVAPSKPTVSEDDFRVVHINKHITDVPNADRLKRLNKEKNTAKSEIESLQSIISKISSRISIGNYKSTSEKNNDTATLNAKIQEKERLSKLVNSLVSDINGVLNTTTSQSVKPVYRVRGFWAVENPITTNAGSQQIVQYAYRYRYVSANSDESLAMQMDFSDNDNKRTAVFSGWVENQTKALTKYIDDDGNLVWVENNVENANEQNINQLDIPIKTGESVQFQVRAITEAGFPTSPIMSDWSDVIRVDFPDELIVDSDLATISSESENDLLLVQLNKEFEARGLDSHVSSEIKEQDKTYYHDARSLASGHLTDEQKIISMYDYIVLLESRLATLEAKIDLRSALLSVEIVSQFDNTTYNVNDGRTIELFAGYYSDEVDVTDSEQYGNIIEKVFYLALGNKETQAITIQSLSNGALNTLTDNESYNNVPLSNNGVTYFQPNGMILYNRNVDQSGNSSFYEDDVVGSETVVDTIDIDTNGNPSTATIVERSDNGTFNTVTPKSTARYEGYSVMSRSHPIYLQYVNNQTTENTNLLDAEFDRLQRFSGLYYDGITQPTFDADKDIEYSANDKYLVGKNTLGDRLFLRVADISSVQVNGVDGASVFNVNAGQTLFLKLVYQFRMTDALGNPNGDSTLNQNSNFSYSKKVGYDVIVGGQKFSFDVVVKSSFRSSEVSNKNLSITELVSNREAIASTQTKIL